MEISLNPDNFEPVRLEFHAGKLFTGQDIKIASYQPHKPRMPIAFFMLNAEAEVSLRYASA